ncbi:TraY domain-containing protein [Oceanicoccus sagamiensis]|nr:TraY domain-containing protein [Oceanicoccus sagamiensis]
MKHPWKQLFPATPPTVKPLPSANSPYQPFIYPKPTHSHQGLRLLCYTRNTRIATEAPMLAIRLPNEIEDRLNNLASKTGRTKTFYAREAILKYLDEMEDRYLAIDRLEKSGKRWTLDEMEQDIDMDR